MWLLHSVASYICPPPKKPGGYLRAENCFTTEELDAIRREHCVHVLSKYTQTLDDTHFLEWAGLSDGPPVLTQGLCRAVRRCSGDEAGAITLDGVIVAKARCEKMDRQTAQDFAFEIMDPQQAGAVSRSHLEAVVLGCIELALPSAPSSETNTVTAAAIAAGACSYSREGAQELTRDGFAKLCKVSPALNAALQTLLSNIGKPGSPGDGAGADAAAAQPADAAAGDAAGSSSPQLLAAGEAGPSGNGKGRHSRSSRAIGSAQQFEGAALGPGSRALAAAAAAAAAAARGPGRVLLPQLGWGLVPPEEGLLQPGWVWLLAAGLAPVQRMEWRLQYNSMKHGLSFSTFMGRLKDACPTLLLVRDKGGAVFGGIAHSPWAKSGAFYGDQAAIIFRLLPEVSIHPVSGINDNIQWCGAGLTMLPGGIGFGGQVQGQVGHFALYLDATLDRGMSRPAATFASPSLSSEEVFQVDVVEAWQLVPPEEEAPSAARKGSSALDKAKEDQKILEWAGVGSNYSAALKDEPIED